MIPVKIQIAKKTPGFYLCQAINVFFIEVDAAGNTYQIVFRTMERDGLLSDAGWLDDSNTKNMRVFRLEEV